MLQTLITSVLAFAATNIDDLFILMMLFSGTEYHRNHIYSGRFLGIITLILISVIGAVTGLFIPQQFIGLLGVFPILLGVKKIFDSFKNRDEEEIAIVENKQRAGFITGMIHPSVINISLITIANGSDNIGIYVPLFATQSLVALGVMICIFLALTYVWLASAERLNNYPAFARVLKIVNPILFPFVLIALGCYIIYESEAYRLFFNYRKLRTIDYC